jgi:hypothetical protein
MHLNKKTAVILAIAMLFSIFAAGCSNTASTAAMNTTSASGLIVSEVSSSNSNALVDPVFGRPDWIELYNASGKSIDLSEYSIATSKGGDTKYDLPKVKLEAGKYLLLYCCPALETQPEGKYCTGFKLSKTGMTLVLSRSESIMQNLNVPQLETDISFGITKQGAYKFFKQPTPGAENSTSANETLAELESSKTSDLLISEVLPESVDDANPYGWVELKNNGKSAIKLSDYYISEDISNPTKGRLPEKTLNAGEYITLKLSGGSGTDELPFKISSVESMLMISNNFGVTIDSMSWDSAVLPGISVGKGKDNAVQYYDKPTPGAQNNSTPLSNIDFALKEAAGDVRINEILLDNTFSLIDTDGDRSPWVELYNAGKDTVSLNGCALSDDKNDLWKFMLPDTELKSGEYLVVFLSGKDRKTGDELHTGFKLGSSDKELVLTSVDSRTKQVVTLPTERKDNVSFGLNDDDSWVYYPSPTPEEENSTKSFPDILSIPTAVASKDLRINEVMAVKEAKGKGNDWVEIYNKSSSAISLKGYFLSDTQKDLKKWPIVEQKAPAKGYAVIEKYKKGSGTEYISISSAGERLFLSDPQGVIVDQYDTGVLQPNMTSGLTGKDGDTKRVFFLKPTKGSANSSSGLEGYAKAPVFSEQGGYKSSSVSLKMSTATSNAAIYYTLDGSTPTTGSTRYSDPVSVSSTKTVRAIAVASGMLQSDETVATFIFGVKHKLPVVCLSITPSDYSKVLSASRNNNLEKAGYVEYYESDGKLGVRFPMGLMIAGAGTRGYAQRSFNLHIRGIYGMSSVTYPFFDNYNITTFKSLSLRNMGQDNVSRIRDLYSSIVVNGMNIDNMQAKFAVLYINGEYRGLYELKENQNEEYMASKHGVDPNKIDMIRGGVNAISGSNLDIKKIYALSERNTNDPEIFKEWTSRVDSDYIMDYVIAQTYLGMHDMYNQKFARSQDYKMKWRALLYDLDSTWDSATVPLLGTYFHSKDLFGPVHEDGKRYAIKMKLYYGYYKNDEWKEKFVERYAEVLNTILTTDKMLDLFNSLVDSVKDEMPRHIKKWGKPASMSSWNSAINEIRTMIKKRRSNVIGQLKSFFDLSNARIKELFPND